MVEIPLTAVFPLFFIAIIYYTAGFNPGIDRFFLFCAGAVLECLVATIMGIFIGTVITNGRLAIEIAPLIFVPMLLFSGFTTNSGNIWVGLKVFEYLSPIRYAFEYFVRVEFENRELIVNPIDNLNFFFEKYQIVIILFGFMFMFMALSIFFLKFNAKDLKN